MVSPLLVAGGGGAFIAGKAGSLVSGNKAKKNAKRAARFANLRMQAQNQEILLQDVRRTRIERAASLAAAVSSGAEFSSASQGAIASIGSQYEHNLQYTTQDMFYSSMIDKYTRRANKYQSQASMWEGIAQLGGTAMSFGTSAVASPEISNDLVTETGGVISSTSINGNVVSNYGYTSPTSFRVR